VSSETDERYVHRPGALDEDGTDDGDPRPDATAATDRTASPTGSEANPDSRGFGDRGWVLVATVVLAFLVIPGIIYLRPALPGQAGLPFVVAMLILPLVPAVLLGLTAVWAMHASRRR
jgi:hypothetical protein